jgi:hypothetical protein
MDSTATATDSYPSPVVSRDSETEDSLASAPMTGHKRAASEMEEDTGNETPKTYAARKTGRMAVAPLSSHKKNKATTAHESQETIEAEPKTDTTFTVECPVWTDSKRYQGRLSRENLYTERDAPPVAEAGNLEVDFSIKPGSEWTRLRRFKNAKCEY